MTPVMITLAAGSSEVMEVNDLALLS